MEKKKKKHIILDYTPPPFSSRWKKRPNECITVDELKFYRRRRPPGTKAGSIFPVKS